MNSSPLITVIVPVYNTAQYLPECIESIVNQTYRNLEIILVNDGSTDNSGDICDEYARKDERIRVIHKENGGQSSARNRGLEVAQGDYISFIDSDDWIDLDTYEVCLEAWDRPELDIVAYSNVLEFPHGPVEEYPIPDKATLREGIDLLKHYVYGNTLYCLVPHYLFKASVLSRIRFIEGIFHEDEAFVLELFAGGEIRLLELPVRKYHYRMRANSTTSTIHLSDNLFGLEHTVGALEEGERKTLANAYMIKAMTNMSSFILREEHLSSLRSRLGETMEPYLEKCRRRPLPYDWKALDFWLFRWSPSSYLKYARYYQFVLRKLNLSSKYT